MEHMNGRLKKLVPGILKEIMSHVPELAFEVIDWNTLLGDLGKISGRIIMQKGISDVASGLPNSIPNQVQLNLERPSLLKRRKPLQVTAFTQAERIEIGETMLQLYFAQFLNPKGVFLDLRTNHFQFDRKTGSLTWSPNAVWIQFDQNFCRGLIDLYKGFYFQDESLFESSLTQVGMMTPERSQEYKEELIGLLKDHFGQGVSHPIQFKLDQFQQSFIQLFQFFLEHKIKLNSQFLFLGTYLVSLYLTLDELEVELDVNKAFRSIFQDANPLDQNRPL